jgi:hypothetical protein
MASFRGFAKDSSDSCSLGDVQSWRMSPTIFRHGNMRFFFFSREEARVHVHVQSPHGEAKFWLEPVVTLAQNHGMNPQALNEAMRLVRQHEQQIRAAWSWHFGR